MSSIGHGESRRTSEEKKRPLMAKGFAYLMTAVNKAPSLSSTEVLQHFGITADYLQVLKDQALVATEVVDNQEQWPQEAIDQIHNIIILEKLFDLGPRSLRPLNNLFREQVLNLRLKDTDLYKYSDAQLSGDPCAEADILALALKKVFLYLALLDGATKDTSSVPRSRILFGVRRVKR